MWKVQTARQNLISFPTAYNKGMKQKDVRCAEMVLEENKELAISKWREYFGSSMTEEEEE